MEGGNTDMAGPVGTTGNSRWNPTKEQISMLESLYRQGIRTPSAVQIQQITNRLKAYGSIESKNVFYWFQNHKARQRQKQKPENMAHINRYLHGTQLVYPPPPRPNAAYGPYFRLPGDSWGKVLIPGGIKSIRRPERFTVGAAHGLVHQGCSNNMLPDIENYKGILNNGNPETLDLFPLHATGVSDGRGTLMSPLGSTTSAGNPTITPSSSCETIPGIDQECLGGEQHFFDFFSCPGSSKSD